MREPYYRYRDIDLDIDIRETRYMRENSIIDDILSKDLDCERCTSDNKPSRNTLDQLEQLLF